MSPKMYYYCTGKHLMNRTAKYLAYIFFIIISIGGVYALFNAKFEFSFEDFFPQNDPDLDYFLEFIEDFETDDNFYLIALENEDGIFDKTYLTQLDSLTRSLKELEHVREVLSLTSLMYPVMTPFGPIVNPAVHPDDVSTYEQDKKVLSEDERFMKTLISEDFSSSIVNLKLSDYMELEASNSIVEKIDSVVQQFDFQEAHYLGRANFQKEMIEMSTNEIIKSSMMASILVLIVMLIIFRKIASIILTMSAIGLAMLGFMFYMYLSGQAFNAMAGLFPILMIIVSTSDVIHLLSKYIDELRKGKTQDEAIKITVRDIGLATLLTSVTTSIGFITLLFSRLQPIKDFGVNAAVGVMIAFGVILLFCWVFFPMFSLHQLANPSKTLNFWERVLGKWYVQTKKYKGRILAGGTLVLILSLIGISLISTNYKLVTNLPIGQKITEDYLYFEKEYAGFRPLEVAVTVKGDRRIDDYDVMQEIVKVEEHVKSYDVIKNVTGYSMIFKSINRMMNGNTTDSYVFPKDSIQYNSYKKFTSFLPKMTSSLLVSKDGKKTRISSRVDDIGAEEVQDRVKSIENWISENTNPDIASYRITGTAMLLDKNMFYVRESLLKGLGFAIVMVSLLMVLLFRNLKLIIISIVPNLLPLLISAGILGFVGVDLEAGIAIVFAIAFGIAVDDTIHFLSKYKLERAKNKTVDQALEVTFKETGKAIIITSIILFFGFMVLFFSIHPPSRSIGILIAVTLVTALIADLYLIPILIRMLVGKKDET